MIVLMSSDNEEIPVGVFKVPVTVLSAVGGLPGYQADMWNVTNRARSGGAFDPDQEHDGGCWGRRDGGGHSDPECMPSSSQPRSVLEV